MYKLKYKIRSGAYGDAFAAEHQKLKFECVVKTVTANNFDEGAVGVFTFCFLF